jgi:hypothetical protein
MADTDGKLAERSRKSRVTEWGRLFISYRRTDSAATAGRIRDWLVQRLPGQQVFFDVEDIEYGVDSERWIEGTIPQCKAVLAIIGPRWLEPEGVLPAITRQGLELALRAGVPIFPVLVEGATMPTPEQLPPSLATFTKINAAQVRSDPDFLHDMAELATILRIPLNPPIVRSPRFWLLASAVVALLALGAIALFTIVPGLTSAAQARTQATLVAGANNQTATAQAAAESQTATAAATQAAASAATATAAASATASATAAVPFSYTAASPGSECGAPGQWQANIPSDPGVSITCPSQGTQLNLGPDQTSLKFSGANNFSFPAKYTLSVDATIEQTGCATLSIQYNSAAEALGYDLQVCNTGRWTITQDTGRAGSGSTTLGAGTVNTAALYTMTITSTGSSIAFSINSTILNTQQDSIPAPLAVVIGGEDYGAAPASLIFSNFEIAAQT